MPGQRLSRPGPRGRRRAGEFDRDTQQLSEAPKVTASACLRAGVSWPCAGVRGCRGRQPAAQGRGVCRQARLPGTSSLACHRCAPRGASARGLFPGGRRLQRPSHQERQRGVAGRAPAEDLRHVTRGPPRPARGGASAGLVTPGRGDRGRALLPALSLPTVRRMCRDQLEDPVFTRFFMKIPCVLEQSWG